ncbi:glycosyltransferase family 4 protein [Paremcibacter congregatus]|uniref:Glycosyl transferase family 1 n=1 Tax=Paremcibacter congregatus TaxID=2043170 RepID=A0A2G4YU24_9PROT|nr:glycosyltransferase family 4 protein [Paremcibacter congregatus]PHZ85777.1 glycosyl transferase family 1 [Paremcibacter congregatus]QDE26738.1 glycosyltransferase [Paremcibacter congregatus]
MPVEKSRDTILPPSRRNNTTPRKLKRVAFIGNYVPRKCGIATFTADLSDAMVQGNPDVECWVIPVNDTAEGYNYPDRARFEIFENDLSSYRHAAYFLNINQVDVVCVQHEFGIHGGPAGSHILTLLKSLHMPIVTVLHTILRTPNADQKKVMDRLIEYSDRLIVMSEMGIEILSEVYDVPESQIDFIPHGIPDFSFIDPHFHKASFGMEGKTTLLTFGLLSENKGIDYVIRALPGIIKKHPDFILIILGATHPHVLRREGESYRLSLERLVTTLGLEEHVIFYNRYVELPELIKFIEVADLYITAYLNEAQITSGTLAYAVGAGKAVLSTPYWHAQELLAEERGVLVPFRDSEKISQEILNLLSDNKRRQSLRRNAFEYGKRMRWSKVAGEYIASFMTACKVRQEHPRTLATHANLNQPPKELLKVDLRHLRRLTDTTGLFQHATYATPNYNDGYSTDDNARGLLFTTLLEEENLLEAADEDLRNSYFAFLAYAFNPEFGRFRNFMAYDRQWQEEVGSEDSHGRSVWALGTVIARSQDQVLCNAATEIFHQALPALHLMTSCRTWAFSLLGLHEYLKKYAGDRLVQKLRARLCDHLMTEYKAFSGRNWPWFERQLTYANAVLPHALLVSAKAMGRSNLENKALDILRWLVDIQKLEKGCFSPIGTEGFYHRRGARARFDQQPTEAQAMVSACLEAYQITKDTYWWLQAKWAFEWYLGQNDLQVPLYDPATGACRDGLHADRANENRGAESTLAFLQSLIEMHAVENMINVSDIRSKTKVTA